MKKLELTFTTAGTSTVTFSIDDPKDGLTLTEVQQKAPDIAKVLVTRAGVQAVALKKATIVNTTSKDLE